MIPLVFVTKRTNINQSKVHDFCTHLWFYPQHEFPTMIDWNSKKHDEQLKTNHTQEMRKSWSHSVSPIFVIPQIFRKLFLPPLFIFSMLLHNKSLLYFNNIFKSYFNGPWSLKNLNKTFQQYDT